MGDTAVPAGADAFHGNSSSEQSFPCPQHPAHGDYLSIDHNDINTTQLTMNAKEVYKKAKENISDHINACKCSDFKNVVGKDSKRTATPRGSVSLSFMLRVLAKSVLQALVSFSPPFHETVKQQRPTNAQEAIADNTTYFRSVNSNRHATRKAAWSNSSRQAQYSSSVSSSTLGIVPILLVIFLIYIPANTVAETVRVRIHAIIPSHFAMITELNREFHTALLNFRRDFRNQKFRSLFNPEGEITFINDDTPKEIMDTFCKGVLGKQVTTILNINNPLGIRRRTSSNEYIIELANYLGIPMISWDSQYSGSSQVSSFQVLLQLIPLFHLYNTKEYVCL